MMNILDLSFRNYVHSEKKAKTWSWKKNLSLRYMMLKRYIRVRNGHVFQWLEGEPWD
jgi:hypothetical protein